MASSRGHRILRIEYAIAIESEVLGLVLLLKLVFETVLGCLGDLLLDGRERALSLLLVGVLRVIELSLYVHVRLGVRVMGHLLRGQVLVFYQYLSRLAA